MRKKVCYIFPIFLASVALLTGCQKEEEDKELNIIDLTQREAIEISDSIFTEQNLELEVSEVSVEIDSRAGARSCFLYENKIFYSLDYEAFFQDSTWNEGQTFDKTYNTQIRMYDINSGEDKLIYQYDEEYCVIVQSLQYNGKTLIWEESSVQNDAWKVMACDVVGTDLEAKMPYVLFKYGDADGKLNSATPIITEDAVLWYDLIKGRDYESVIYKYDFKQNNITVLKSGIDTWTPYDRVICEGNLLISYKYGADSSNIFIEEGTNTITVDILGKVAGLRGNNKICAWKKSVDENREIQVYDIKNDDFYYVCTDYFFSFAVLDDTLIINQDNGVWAYDIENMTYMPIQECDGIYCGYIFDGYKCKYSFVRENEDSKFTVLIIKEGR